VPHPLDRRSFLAAATAAVAAPGLKASDSAPPFKISLAQWSLHKAFGRGGKPTLDPADFPVIAKKEFGIEAVEYVNQFYKDKKGDDAFVAELKKKCDDHGVRSVLIMCDGEGNLGDPADDKRTKAVENHKRWLEWAKALGCHSIRVNAASNWKLGFDETQKLAADGLRKLTELGGTFGISVIVENHGGLSSHGGWLAGVMKLVNLPGCGTLPDFGNFNIGKIDGQPASYDRYQGTDELMPFAKGVSAKSYDFDADGNETKMDYRKLLGIVCKKHKYNGYVGIEYEGGRLGEPEGILATKRLLEAVRGELAKG
jgi:sugar phosphate isomerase/epimerase